MANKAVFIKFFFECDNQANVLARVKVPKAFHFFACLRSTTRFIVSGKKVINGDSRKHDPLPLGIF